jgi:hypothetical protein
MNPSGMGFIAFPQTACLILSHFRFQVNDSNPVAIGKLASTRISNGGEEGVARLWNS